MHCGIAALQILIESNTITDLQCIATTQSISIKTAAIKGVPLKAVVARSPWFLLLFEGSQHASLRAM
jgi:hypothetical protein